MTKKTANRKPAATELDQHNDAGAAEAAADELPPCLCGCGLQVRYRRRQFRQGHDARLKGRLQRHFRGIPRETDPSLDELFANYELATGDQSLPQPEDPKEAAYTLTRAYNPDWERFLQAPLSQAKKKTARTNKSHGKKSAAKPSDLGEVVTRKVGRWSYTGRRVGEDFVYRSKTDSSQELRVPFDRTHAT